MKFALCTCNRTSPVDADHLAQRLGGDTRVYDALCRGGLDGLTGGSSTFVGCAREADHLMAALEEAGTDPDHVIAWDVPRWVQGLTPERATRWTAAYAGAARALLEGARPTPDRAFEIGPRVVVSGPGGLEAAGALADHLDVTWVGDDEPPEAVRWLPGTVQGVEGVPGTLRVSIQARTPVDPTVCVRCDACVDACPHGALGPGYRLDPGRCDGCRRCEQACARVDALDLDRSQQVLTADQVLWAEAPLDRMPPGVRGPDPRGGWARAATETLAWADAGQVVIDDPLALVPDRCTHRHAGTGGCSRCADACPTGAFVTGGASVKWVRDRCVGCLACVATCPTGALDALPWDEGALGRALDAFAEGLEGDAPVALTCPCSDAPTIPEGAAPFPVPEVAALQASHLLGLLAGGVPAVHTALCPRCAAIAEPAVDLARRALTHGGDGRCDEALKAPDGVSWAGELPWGDRRGALASVLLPLVNTRPGGEPLEGPFASVKIDGNRCTGCGACLDACRTGALTGDVENMALVSREALCVGCGLCAGSCPEDAIRLRPGLSWSPDAFRPRQAHRCDPLACPSCGKVFGTRQALASVLGRLGGNAPADAAGLLSLCPDCRVARIYNEE